MKTVINCLVIFLISRDGQTFLIGDKSRLNLVKAASEVVNKVFSKTFGQRQFDLVRQEQRQRFLR